MLKAEQFRQDTKAFWSKMDQIGKVVAADHVRPTKSQAACRGNPPPRQAEAEKKKALILRGALSGGGNVRIRSVPAVCRRSHALGLSIQNREREADLGRVAVYMDGSCGRERADCWSDNARTARVAIEGEFAATPNHLAW